MGKINIYKKVAKIFLLLTICTSMGLNMLSSMLFAQDTGNDFSNSDEITQINSYQYEKNDGTGTKIAITDGIVLNEKDIKSIIASYSFKLVDPDTRSLKEGDFYYVSLPNKAITANDTGQITDAIGELIADWEVVNGNKIKITFTSYVNEEEGNYSIEGHFELSFGLNFEKNPDGSPLIISLPISKDTNIDFEIKPYEAPPTTPSELSKVGEYNKDTHEIVWTIALKDKSQDWSNYTFTDTLDANLTLSSIISYDDMNNSTTLTQGVDYTYVNNTISISSISTSTKKLAVITKVNSSVYASNSVTTIDNTAQIQDKTDPTNPGVIISGIAPSVPIKKDWISKTGNVVDGNLIEWTITVNKEKLKMKNPVVTDELSTNLIFDTNTPLSIKVGNKTTVLKADGVGVDGMSATLVGRTLTINLTKSISSDTYEIKFKTAVDPTAPNKKYNNIAKLAVDYWTGEGDTYAPWTSPSIGTGDIPVPSLNITKSGKLNKQNGIITWNIMGATNTEKYKGTTLIDTINKDDNSQTFTGRIKITDIQTGNNEEYQIAVPTDDNPTTSTTTFLGKSITITFTGAPYTSQQTMELIFNYDAALKNSVKIEVDTQLKDSIYLGKAFSEGKLTFKNEISGTIKLLDNTNETKTANASVTEQNKINEKANINKADYPVALTNPNNNPMAYYKIVVNPNMNILENVVLKDDLNNIVTLIKKNGATSDETLPDVKWTLVPKSIKIEQKTSDSFTGDDMTNIITKATNAYNEQENILTLDFSEKAIKTQYTIYFAVEIAREIDGVPIQNNFINMNGTLALKDNTSKLSHKLLAIDETINSKPTEKKEVGSNTLIDKTGSYNKENGQIDYRLNLNQHKQFLGNPFIVEDYMSDAIILDPSSVTLYKDVLDKDGNFTKDLSKATKVSPKDYVVTYQTISGVASHPNATSKAIFTLPKNTSKSQDEAYILVYSVDIKDGHFNETITNDALIPGISSNEQDSSSKSDVKVNDSSGGSSTKRSNAQLHKVDANGNALQGATFSLYWRGNDTETFISSMTTDAFGDATFKGLKPTQNYVIKETKAPTGYTLSDEEWNLTPTEAGKTYKKDKAFINHVLVSDSIQFKVQKMLAGKEWLSSRNFNIVLSKAAQNTFTEDMSNLTYDSLQSLTFTNKKPIQEYHAIQYPYKSGDTYYYYKIEESALTTGYQNDTGIYYIRVKVTGNDANNTLSASVDKITLVKGSDSRDLDISKLVINNTVNLLMENSYHAPNVTYKIKGRSGYDKADANDPKYLNPLFTYELYKKGTNTPIATIVPNADGSFEFPELSFRSKDIGTHHYTIVVKQNLSNISYDVQYDIEITVIDNDDGTLSITSKITHNGKEMNDIIFEHVYHEEEAPTPTTPEENTPTDGNHGNTLTGDDTSIYTPIILMMLSIMTGFIVYTKRKKLIHK